MLQEWIGAYDGWMAMQCYDCGQRSHRCGKEIISAEQRPDYGQVDFVLEGGLEYVNLFPKR